MTSVEVGFDSACDSDHTLVIDQSIINLPVKVSFPGNSEGKPGPCWTPDTLDTGERMLNGVHGHTIDLLEI